MGGPDDRDRRSRRLVRFRRLYREANGWQRAVVAVCAVVAAHGMYVLLVPGVQPSDTDLPCPPALLAAVAGDTTSGVEPGEAGAQAGERHHAACASTGRFYTVAALLQVGLAVVWGLATLEWARTWRSSREHR